MKAAAARQLLQPQPKPQPQPQPQRQLQSQPQIDAQAKAVAQHAKAQRAQAEFRRLQVHFAQLQHPSMAKCPPLGSARDRLFCACSRHFVGSGQLGTSRATLPGHPVTAPKPYASKIADQTSFGPPGSRSSKRSKRRWLQPRCIKRRSKG